MPPDDPLRLMFAPPAAVVSGLLFLFVAARSPANTFTRIFLGILGGILFWNAAECCRIFYLDRRFLALQGVGFTPLPALFFHLALLLGGRTRHHHRWLVPAYGLTVAFFVSALAAWFSDDVWEVYDGAGWNVAFILLGGTLIVAALRILHRRHGEADPASRAIVGLPLLAGVALGFTGILELAHELWKSFPPLDAIPPLANLGSAVASVLLAAAVFRHRGVFDSLARMRTTTDRLFGAMNRGLVAFDHRGRPLYSNPRAAELLGAAPASLPDLPRPLRDLHPAGGTRLFKRGDAVVRATLVVVDTPVREASFVHLMLEDATAEYELHRELAQAESLTSMGEAAATLAHEIRTPLTAIGSAAEGLRPGEPADGERVELLRSGVDRLKNLVTRSLDFSRDLEPEPEPWDLAELLRRIVEKAPEAPRLRLEPGPDLPRVSVDPDLMGQLVMNLVRNAAEAGAAEVVLSAEVRGKDVALRVFNGGPPVPEATLERAFLPFVTTKASGTGLGLALCRKIARAHGGEIGIRNVEGGVECEVLLPWTS